MLKSTNKHVGIFSFIGNNILMFIFTLAFGALITSRGIDLSAVTPAKIFFSAMYIGLVFVVSSVCGYHNNRGGLIALLLVVAVSNRRNDWLHDGGAGGCELVRGGSAVLFCVPPRKHAFNAGDGGGQPDTPVWG